MTAARYFGYSFVLVGATLMVACADQNGFRARVTTQQDVLRANMLNGTNVPNLRQGLPLDGAGGQAGQGGQSGQSQPFVFQRPEAAGTAPPVVLTEEDRAARTGFAEVARQAAARAAAAEEAAKKGEAEDKDKQGGSATQAVSQDAEAIAKMAEKINEINQNLKADGATLVRGLEVKVENKSDRDAKAGEGRFEISVDMLLVGNSDVAANGKAVLTGKDLLSSQKIVSVPMVGLNNQAQVLKLTNVEVFASCLKDTCQEVHVMILLTREDNSKVGVVGQFMADGKSLGTTLGNQLRTIKQAQDEIGNERAQREQGEKERSASLGAATAGAGSADRGTGAGAASAAEAGAGGASAAREAGTAAGAAGAARAARATGTPGAAAGTAGRQQPEASARASGVRGRSEGPSSSQLTDTNATATPASAAPAARSSVLSGTRTSGGGGSIMIPGRPSGTSTSISPLIDSVASTSPAPSITGLNGKIAALPAATTTATAQAPVAATEMSAADSAAISAAVAAAGSSEGAKPSSNNPRAVAKPAATAAKRSEEVMKLDQIVKAQNSKADALISEIKLKVSKKTGRSFVPGVNTFEVDMNVLFSMKNYRRQEVRLVEKQNITDYYTLTDNKFHTFGDGLFTRFSLPGHAKIEVYGACVEKGCEKFKLMILMTKMDRTEYSVIRTFKISSSGEATLEN